MSETLFVGKICHRFEELSSTNDHARNLLAKSKPPEGTVVWADNQTAGRGQLGRQWIATPFQNVTLSVVFYPTWLAIVRQFDLSIAVALAVHDVVMQAVPADIPVHVKWPNDILLGGKKTAGILIETAIQAEQLRYAVVGIGLNVNQTVFGETLSQATSIRTVSGHLFDREEVAQRLFRALEHRYLQLRAGRSTEQRMAYAASLWQKGVRARFERLSDGVLLEGVIEGVDELGRLRVQTDSGVQVFGLQAVRFC